MSPGLAGIAEVAQILGVSIRTAHRYANRPDFPKPLDELATGRVWKRADIEKWARKPPVPLGRGKGRPPKPRD
ncbi:MAG TPA: helix-turn-helix domain-containing protein [Gaiellaceae bacterium]